MSSVGESQAPQPGQICWLEVPCTDPDRALAFYHEVLGWNAVPSAGERMPGYMDGVDSIQMFNKGNLSGAFVKMTAPDGVAAVADAFNPAKIPILPTFMVEDVEKTLALAEKNGAKLHLPKLGIAGGTMGHCARFIDTEGNLVAVWTPPAKACEE